MLKKSLWLILPAVVLCVALVPRPVHGNNAAVVINGTGCNMLDGNGNGVFTDISHAVETSSGRGVFNCRVTTTPASGGGAVHWNYANTGLQCADTDGDLTNEWQETVSASGQAQLSCHFNE
jgi:hypothetical protein